MSKIDPCYERWIALGAPRHTFQGLQELVDQAIYLSLICSPSTRPIMFEFAVDEATAEAAYFNPWAGDFERTWLYAFLSLSIADRASLLAAHEQFWNPLRATRIAA